MDITFVCIIIGGTRNKIKIKFIQGAGPSYRATNSEKLNKK